LKSIEVGKTLGFKDMHPQQIADLMDFFAFSMDLASSLESEEIIEEAKTKLAGVITIFGGMAIDAMPKPRQGPGQ
jgi:hypothetical protein